MKFLVNGDASKSKEWLMNFTAGALAGTAASIISNPMDVIKTHRQMSLSPSGTVSN